MLWGDGPTESAGGQVHDAGHLGDSHRACQREEQHDVESGDRQHHDDRLQFAVVDRPDLLCGVLSRPGDRGGDAGRDQQPDQEPHQSRSLKPAEKATQQPVGDHRADGVGTHVGEHQSGGGTPCRDDAGDGDGQRDVGRRDRALDPEDGPGALKGVEPAQHQVVDGEEHQTDREQGQRGRVVREGVRGGEPAVDDVRQVVGDQRKQQRERDDQCQRAPQGGGDSPGNSGEVMVRGIDRQSREHGGRQRHGGDRVGHHHQQERLGVDRVAGAGVITRQTSGGAAAGLAGDDPGTGYTIYSQTFLLVMVPHSIATVSLATAVLPRLSVYAADHDLTGVARGVSSTLRSTLTLIIPFALLLPLIAYDLANIVYGWLAAADAFPDYAPPLSLFAIGLVFFTVHYLMLRGFYSLERTRTVFWIQCAVAATNIALAIAVTSVVSAGGTASGLVLAYVGSCLLYTSPSPRDGLLSR